MKFFRFASSTPPPPPPPTRPPAPPLAKSAAKPLRPKSPAPPATPSLIGRWQEPGSSDTTEFRADGTLVERLGSGETINGRFSLNGSRLKIKLESVGELSFSATIEADALALTDPDGQVTQYRRA
jgi:hypothetical protein